MKRKKTIKVAIRDDDLCYYSNFDDFKRLYDQLDIPVSISLVPYGVANHGNEMPYGKDKPKNVPRLFCENTQLVEGLQKGIQNNKYEILLHGYTHEYRINSNGTITGEMLWKTREQIEKEVSDGKRIIEEKLNVKVKTFVAPSQEINQKGIDAIVNHDLNYSGMANRLKDRSFSFHHLVHIFKRYVSRIIYGRSLMGIVDYRNHKEQCVVGLCEFDELKRYFKICKKHKWNLVVITHYWQLLENKQQFNSLLKFVNYIKEQGLSFSFVGELF